ncbi:MAG: TRAP transporter small permease [Candidatus Caldatribacterium sp.]|uniref:TRAP transporter small permease n=1 Tax=Candidatus Caldatribacterium sp. TaxID=2282143 RepID=UPI002994BD6A|nr:TRAP transporter small permease [Candidatus Caldatribacterium sp.]MCX7730999.1 TRAP transporter small permease [Candidatus Caldatribacterium sp.]MDW8080649.1 TRAP transporter small permease [Candidatus Calescibacterium sp.]
MKSQKICGFLKVLEVAAALAFVVMLFLVVTQVLVRYILPFSIPWTEEAARYTLMLITFVGAAAALRKGDHICVSTFIERMSQRVQRKFYLGFAPIMFIFLSIVLYGSLGMAKRMWSSPVGSISWLRMGHLYLISLTGSSLMLVALILWSKEVFESKEKMLHCTDRSGV